MGIESKSGGKFPVATSNAGTIRGVNGTDIIRPSDRPKKLIIRLDSFFRILDSNSDSTVRLSDTDMI
jgi:hypothetical protein